MSISETTLEQRRACIRLFSALPIDNPDSKKVAPDSLVKQTLSRGFVFDDMVTAQYASGYLSELARLIGLSPEQMNSSFHKSWDKVANAPLGQLIIEQVMHYITTYGFEAMGVYSQDTVFIPYERLEVPELEANIHIRVIHGLTIDDLLDRLLNLVGSGIALSDDVLNDITTIALVLGFKSEHLDRVKNKEVLARLCMELDLVPTSPEGFLRYLLYNLTQSTLLIKSPAVIESIKSESPKNNTLLASLFRKYEQGGGTLQNLSSIFYRFKPLFLAMRSAPRVRPVINKLRRLAKANHKPMTPDLLNSYTGRLGMVSTKELAYALDKANVFRKTRLAYAIKYRTLNTDSIMYKIRNGSGYVETEFAYSGDKKILERDLETVLNSITLDTSGLDDQTVYIPEFIDYTLPATQKQFSDKFPNGTRVTMESDMIFGVHWENLPTHRIDLDLSIIDMSGSKYGWDASYRSSDRKILFSGDVTNAPGPKGASEFFYVAANKPGTYLVYLNYFNYNPDAPVPFNIIVGKHKGSLHKNHTIDPNDVIVITDSEIDKKQRILGIVDVTRESCNFYFAEVDLGRSVSSHRSTYYEATLNYMYNFYTNGIMLRDILKHNGLKIVDKPEDASLDLSPNLLAKDTIINLMTGDIRSNA